MATVTVTRKGTQHAVTVPDDLGELLRSIEGCTFGWPVGQPRTEADLVYGRAVGVRLKQLDPTMYRDVYRPSPAGRGPANLRSLIDLARSSGTPLPASDLIRSTTAPRKAATVAPPITRTIDPDALDLRRSKPADERDAALKMIERAGERITSDRADALDALVRSVDADDRDASVIGREMARRTVATMRPAYESGFRRYLRSLGQPHGRCMYTAAEEAAISTVREELMRTASEGGSFGLAMPVVIDPTIVVSGGEVAPIASAAHIVTTVSDVWKGVTSAPPSFAWDAESAVIADDTPTLVQPSIPIFKADSYIPATFEVFSDYGADGFVAEFTKHLQTGFLDLLSTATAVGSGSGQPTGLFTAMQATTTSPSHVTVTTAGSLSATDVRNVWKAVPPRFRANATFVMSESVLNQIRNFNSAGAQVDLLTDRIGSTLFGRPIIETDAAPAWTGTTGAANILVVGDLSGYTVAVRAGMNIEVVNVAVDAATFRPIMQRGLYAYARVGATVSVPQALRLLSNT